MYEDDEKTYIVKPDNSAQGKGIYLIRYLEEIDQLEGCIIQDYVN